MGDEADETTRLPGLDPDVLYEGWGVDILEQLVEPALGRSTSYDRLTSYFTLDSMLAVAEGIDQLWRRGGEMRLIIGIHDIPPEIFEAKETDEATVEEMVESVRCRLLDEVSTVEQEFQRDKLATLAWMLNDGLLQIRIACPVTRAGHQQGGIFHKKRLIFRDDDGNTLVAVGSPNETVAGFRDNVEELTVFRTWDESQRTFVDNHVESFERIWDDGREYLKVVDIDDSFGDELLERLGSPTRPPAPSTQSPVRIPEILETARSSPAYSVLSFENVGLYPHQERVFVEALSRWPVRVLLADEVGLGKTLEAGAILTYLLRFGRVDEATILAPANLLKQWQDELHVHFGLEFWRWSSDDRAYISPDGEYRGRSLGRNPIDSEAPDKVLISAQLARGTSKKGHIYEESDRRPDILLVDEAHAARVRPDLDGSFRPTRLYKTLDDITDEIPHVVFTTATPLQTNLEEYHALLDLLGLPGVWEDFEAYERSLSILSKGEDASSLRNAQWILKLIGATLDGMDFTPDDLSRSERELVEVARGMDGGPSFDDASRVREDWSSAYDLLVKLHPAHLLTLRTNRKTLIERGYRFPNRRFESPALEVPAPVNRFYDALHVYLQDAYGQVEKAANPDREISMGFAKSSYHQRTASSLHSAVRSLENRKEKIEGIIEGFDSDEEILQEEYEEPDFEEEDVSESELSDREQRKLERAKTIEISYIKDLLGKLEDVVEGGEIRDPKLEKMMELLENHLSQDAVLVFSRYTDTLDACLKTFENRASGDLDVGYGMYTGDEAWITTDGGRTAATKQDVKAALEDGDIELVFCSEAAAEGLNLQAARVMINIDVPWNPAKLEQRIGRIARLGQTADEVLIYNLWYPDSVEAKMYSRLTERKDLYDIAVGQSPEIVSNAIRSQVTSGSQAEDINTEETLEKLGDIRQSIQRRAMEQVWGSSSDSMPLSSKVRSEFLQVLDQCSPHATIFESNSENRLVLEEPGEERIEASSEPEDESILTLEHDVFRILEQAQGRIPTDYDFLVIEDPVNEQKVALCLEREESVAVVPPSELPSLISSLMGKNPITDFVEDVDWKAKDSADLKSEVHAESRWLPDYQRMEVPFDSSQSDDGDLSTPNWAARFDLTQL